MFVCNFELIVDFFEIEFNVMDMNDILYIVEFYCLGLNFFGCIVMIYVLFVVFLDFS